MANLATIHAMKAMASARPERGGRGKKRVKTKRNPEGKLTVGEAQASIKTQEHGKKEQGGDRSKSGKG